MNNLLINLGLVLKKITFYSILAHALIYQLPICSVIVLIGSPKMEDEDYQEESAGVVVFENETNGGTISIFDELKIALPVYLENLLIRSGFDSLETVKLINREVVDEVEEFARFFF